MLKKATEAGKEFDVLLAGYFGFHNLGDELLALSAIETLVDCGLRRERIAVLTASGDYGVATFDRWNLRSAVRAIGRSRTLLYAGGGLFQDTTSLRSCLYYWGLSFIASKSSCTTWAMGQSVGPFRTKMARYLTRNAFTGCKYITVRDDLSQQLLSSLGIEARPIPDLVLGMYVPPVRKSDQGPVLINVRPTQDGEPGKLIAGLAGEFSAKGIPMIGVALSPEDAEEFERLKNSHAMPNIEVHLIDGAGKFAGLANGCRAAVGMRLHFGILCYLAGIAPWLYPYDPKVRAFSESFGLELLHLNHGEDGFDITNLLTNNAHSVKSKREAFYGQIKSEFELALESVIGGSL